MGRGKNNRRRASLDGPAPTITTAAPTIALKNNSICTEKDTNEEIEYHFKNLPCDLKQFLLTDPHTLPGLTKFLDYWTHPTRVSMCSQSIAASICGCSWYLSNLYMSIGKVAEARALLLNGCFLQQCYNTPIEEIADITQRALDGTGSKTQGLPCITDGLRAIATPDTMSAFLRSHVSADYQRRMSFATQTTQSKKKVQDYVSQIGSDWSSGGDGKKNKARQRRASVDSNPADSFIDIKFVDGSSEEETIMRYGLSLPLKSLFKKYTEDRNLSLRQLRFTYEGRTLFLSSVGNKTPQDMGMKEGVSILVINNNAAAQRRDEKKEEEVGSSYSSDESKENSKLKKPRGGSKKGKKPRNRRASWAGPETIGEAERHKLQHSKQLSHVFSEVAPQFEQIRQRLNALNLTCTPPKVKKGKKKLPASPVDVTLPLVHNTEGVGGKVGVPFYAVHVGAPENLYNTKKNTSLQGQKPISIDLHGLTKQQAISELDAKLPQWIDVAMRGSCPWVILVVIICGGGNQILSEAVDGWIKCNENVAKAPKKKFSRRRCSI